MPEKRLPELFNVSWTSYIIPLLCDLSSTFSCFPDVEYGPRLDVAYFDRGQTPDWDEWAMEAAIEHENNVFWQEELCKLLLVNAGLKVLIAYSEYEKEYRERLNQFVDIHKSRKYNTSGCGWLFIIGPRLIPASHDFLAFKFDGEGIVDITNGSKIIL